MAGFKAVREELEAFEEISEEKDKELLSKIHEEGYMNYKLLQYLDNDANQLHIIIVSDSRWHGRLLLGYLYWKESMYKWTTMQWAYLVLEVALKLNLSNNIITIHPQYKLQPSTQYKRYKKFVSDLNVNITALTSKYSKYSKYAKKFIMMEFAYSDMEKDVAMMFDVMLKKNDIRSHLVMNQIFRNVISFKPHFKYPTDLNIDIIDNILNALKKQSKYKAYTYFPNHTEMCIRDKNGTIYDTHWQYIWSRFNMVYKQSNKQNGNKYTYKYCAKFVYDLLCLPVDKELLCGRKLEYIFRYKWSCMRRKRMFEGYIIPRRWRKMYRNYGAYLYIEYRKKCAVCGCIERFDIIENLRESDETVMFVDKIYCCVCLRFYVCSRKCQKIGWSDKQFKHREQCSARIRK